MSSGNEPTLKETTSTTTGTTALTQQAQQAYTQLAAWWEVNARDLPWRFGRTSPWGVLVSEVMSQQTPMTRVVPYWTVWMTTWPDAAALADATTAEVVTAWGRLGYPRRALRLRECAYAIANDYSNELPCTYDELVALPGIGDYTASAVISFAYGKRIAVIDTNIRRVLSRIFHGAESRGGAATKSERVLTADVLPIDDAASVTWNQSVMELGAVICTARSPQCDVCPLSQMCVFLKQGRPGLGERRTRPRQRFDGTDRQVRGIVLDALRKLPAGDALSRTQTRELWSDHVQLDACIASLDDDGLIEMTPDGSLRLPN